jgi:hypothetical protein
MLLSKDLNALVGFSQFSHLFFNFYWNLDKTLSATPVSLTDSLRHVEIKYELSVISTLAQKSCRLFANA